MEKAVRRDCHKMHAFVRFQEVLGDDGVTGHFAWFEPEHDILAQGADFFVKRFPNMRWSIATPDGTAVWDMKALTFIDAPQVKPSAANDEQAALWRVYYRSICNAARINPRAMQREMPQRYWKNLPEASDIGVLIRDQPQRFALEQRETVKSTVRPRGIAQALDRLPRDGELNACRRCELWRHATQAVAGEGSLTSGIMLVGEQPGDEEDLRGAPFVGPAGKVIDECLQRASLQRQSLYITNAVKHFKWKPRGKRRLHEKPAMEEITACNGWLQREIADLKPRLVVALGGTALRALLGRSMTVEAARASNLQLFGGAHLIATYHPSAVLRAEGTQADDIRAALIQDLIRARELASDAPESS